MLCSDAMGNAPPPPGSRARQRVSPTVSEWVAVVVEPVWFRLGSARAAKSVLSIKSMASDDELKAEIERLRAENEALKKPSRGQMSLKVSEKGALSVYGLGRFPVTLYREQWEKLLGMATEIQSFIQENDARLKKKE